MTDFGGTVKYKRGETCVDGALRELSEESLGCFETDTSKDAKSTILRSSSDRVQNSTCVYTDNMLIIFLLSDIDILLASRNFYKKISKTSKPEVNRLVWISQDDMMDKVHKLKYTFYKPVNDILIYLGYHFYPTLQ